MKPTTLNRLHKTITWALIASNTIRTLLMIVAVFYGLAAFYDLLLLVGALAGEGEYPSWSNTKVFMYVSLPWVAWSFAHVKLDKYYEQLRVRISGDKTV